MDHSQPATVADGRAITRLAVSATLHCLTGCAIGEVLGMVIGTALGWTDLQTIVLAVALAFLFGYAFTIGPVMRSGLALRAAIPVALVADTISITIMEIVDNAIMLLVPGAMDAGLDSLLFWGALAFALAVAFVVTVPVNRWLIARGRGHAVVQRYHRPSGDGDAHAGHSDQVAGSSGQCSRAEAQAGALPDALGPARALAGSNGDLPGASVAARSVAHVKVELLWFAGCPSWQEADARLREALLISGTGADVVLVEVATPEDAERLRFRGSPTVLVDGRDPFAHESAPVGLSCRVFRTPDGLRGAPTVEQLVTVLRSAT